MTTKFLKKDLFEISLILFIFLTINFLTFCFQQPLSANDHLGWDGLRYATLGMQFSLNKPLTVDPPYVYRIGTPFLAALFSRHNIIQGFILANHLANILIIILFNIWIRIFITKSPTRIILNILCMTQWLGPFRFIYFYPTYIDPWTIALLLASLIFIHRCQTNTTISNILLVSILTGIGVLFREVLLLNAVVVLFVKRSRFNNHLLKLKEWHKNNFSILLFMPAVAGTTILIFLRYLCTPIGNYSWCHIAIENMFSKSIASYLLGWFITFGPMLILLFYFYRTVKKIFLENQYLFVYFLIIVFLGYIGGGDTERYLLWAMPVIYVLIGKVLENHATILNSTLLWIVLGLTQALSFRIFWTIPINLDSPKQAFPFLAALGSDFSYRDLWSFYGKDILRFTLLCQYLTLFLIITVWLNFKSRRFNEASLPLRKI